MIQGHGNSNAHIVLLGDGGTNDCVASNYALSGYNETLLQQLAGYNFHIKDTYRTLLIKEKINLNEVIDKGKGKGNAHRKGQIIEAYQKLINQYAPMVLDELRSIQPLLVIPTGELSFRWLSGLRDLRKYRGSVLYSTPDLGLAKPYKIMGVLGPQPYIIQDFKMRWVTKIDFEKVPRNLNTDPPLESRLNVHVARTSSELRNFFDRSWREDGFVNFDIETLLGSPTCISFCFDGQESVTIPFLDKSIDSDTRALMMIMCAKVLYSAIAKGNQNIKYDWKVLERFNFIVSNVVDDPMLAASLLTPELPKNLGFLTSIYTDLPYHKGEGKEYDVYGKKDKEKFYLYCAKDSLASYRIIAAQKEELLETGQYVLYKDLIKLIPIYRKIEDRGLRIDDEQRKRLLAKYETLHSIQLLKLEKMVGRPVNPSSPKVMDTLVYEELGFKKGRYAKDTGEESLEWLIEFGDAKHSPVFGKLILNTIISTRKIHKVIEYLNTIPYPDGRWRCEYNLAGTETGRTTAGTTTDALIVREIGKKGTKLSFEQLGRSFQTIAKHGFKIDGETYGKELRSIFIPSPGYVFVEIDLSQAEARVDAVLAGNFNILSVFDGPVGIHRLTGSWMFNCDPMDIKKNTLEYLMSKTGRHAAERNMKPDRMVMMIQEPRHKCEAALNKIHAMQPELRGTFHREIRQAIDSDRTLIAPNGRTRQFLGRIDESLYNEAISQLPQCIVSDQTKTSLIPTFSVVDEYAYLINEAHDGTLAEVREGRELEYATVYKGNVEKGIDFRKCTLSRDYELIIPCEVSVSKGSWQDLEDVKI